MFYSAAVVLSGISLSVFFLGFLIGKFYPGTRSLSFTFQAITATLILSSCMATVIGAPMALHLIFIIPASFCGGICVAKKSPVDSNTDHTIVSISQGWFWFLGTVIVFVAVIVRYVGIGEFGLRLDEMYQFRTAVGWLNTGHFVQWDFIGQQPWMPYHRAWISTWVIGWSMKIFGVSMWSARLPSLVLGIALLLPYFFMLRVLNLFRWQQLTSILLLVLSPFAITISRWIRMYSFFEFVFVVLLLTLFYYVNTSISRCRSWVIPVVLLLLVAMSIHFHLLTLLITPALAVYLIWEWFLKRSRRGEDAPLLYLLVAGVIFLAGLVSLYFVYDELTQFISIGGYIYPMYGVYLFQEMFEFSIGGMILGATIIYYRRTSVERCALCILLVPIVFMVIFSARFPQVRYSGFLIPLAIPVFVQSTTRFARALFPQSRRLLILTLCLLLIILPLRNLPDELNFIADGNVGYVAFPGVHSPKYKKATRFLINRHPRSYVVFCDASTYYVSRLKSHGIKARGVSEKKRLDPREVKKLERKHGDLMWVMPTEMLACVNNEAKDTIKNRYQSLNVPDNYYVGVFKRPSESDRSK